MVSRADFYYAQAEHNGRMTRKAMRDAVEHINDGLPYAADAATRFAADYARVAAHFALLTLCHAHRSFSVRRL